MMPHRTCPDCGTDLIPGLEHGYTCAFDKVATGREWRCRHCRKVFLENYAKRELRLLHFLEEGD
jgi:RNase P subunit RPR2